MHTRLQTVVTYTTPVLPIVLVYSANGKTSKRRQKPHTFHADLNGYSVLILDLIDIYIDVTPFPVMFRDVRL